MNRRLPWLILPLGALWLDWTSKVWVQAHVQEPRAVIPGFFNLVLTFNTGAIFGSFAGASSALRTGLFVLATVVALAYFGYEFLREGTSTAQRIALGLILGGAMGNGLDRFLHGNVTDFLDFVFWGWHYWAFNLADSCIVCGAILFALTMLAGWARRTKLDETPTI